MVNRRRFLGLIGAGSIGALAGCPTPPDPPDHNTTPTNQTPTDGTSDNMPDNFNGNLQGIKPEGQPPAIPNHEFCTTGDRSQHPVFVDLGKVKTGDYEDWELRVSSTNIDVGKSFAIELKNTSSTAIEFGNKWRFNIQLYTEQGWQEVRWLKKQIPYKDISRMVEPGSGVRWEFYSSAAGIIATHPYSNYMVVCPELPPGRYRFICGDFPVAVQFNIVS